MKLLCLLIFCAPQIFCQTTFSRYSDKLEKNTSGIGYTDSAFAFAKGLTFIEYDDCNNCALRAQIMNFVISNRYPGIKTGKVWLFAGSKLSSKKDYYKTHQKKFLSYKGMCPSWGFHVAPVMIFENDTLVIDPSTQNGPVKISDWIKNISSSTESFVIIKHSIYYSFPQDENRLFINEAKWKEKNFAGRQHEIDFYSEKLTLAYHHFLDPLKFNFYKNKISALVE